MWRLGTTKPQVSGRKNGVPIPGPQSHAMKRAFENYFLWKARHGYVNLP